MRPRSLTSQIARSVDAPVALAPHFADLFAGMPSLGSQPGVVVRLLRDAGLRRGSTIIELACGKGTIAVRLAREFHARVTALDGCDAFIQHARALATRGGVADRCQFELADIRSAALLRRLRKHHVDAAIMLGLDGVEAAAPVLRSLVRPGGLYVLDDAVLDPSSGHTAAAYAPTLAEAEAILRRRGDPIVAAHRPAPSQTASHNARLYARLRRNAAALRRQQPSLSTALEEFLRRQREANRLLSSRLTPVVWIVRQATSSKRTGRS